MWEPMKPPPPVTSALRPVEDELMVGQVGVGNAVDLDGLEPEPLDELGELLRRRELVGIAAEPVDHVGLERHPARPAVLALELDRALALAQLVGPEPGAVEVLHPHLHGPWGAV